MIEEALVTYAAPLRPAPPKPPNNGKSRTSLFLLLVNSITLSDTLLFLYSTSYIKYPLVFHFWRLGVTFSSPVPLTLHPKPAGCISALLASNVVRALATQICFKR